MQSADMERDARRCKLADHLKSDSRLDPMDVLYAAAIAIAETRGRQEASMHAYAIADWYGCELELHGDRRA